MDQRDYIAARSEELKNMSKVRQYFRQVTRSYLPSTLAVAGERAAAKVATRRGGKIIARNWRCATGELDLVVQYADELAIIEVKTRRSDVHHDFSPLDAVDNLKRDKLAAVASHYYYLNQHKLELLGVKSYRFDIAAVVACKRGLWWRCKVEYFERFD